MGFSATAPLLPRQPLFQNLADAAEERRLEKKRSSGSDASVESALVVRLLNRAVPPLRHPSLFCVLSASLCRCRSVTE